MIKLKEQVLTLKKAFDAFDHEKKGAITTETTGTDQFNQN